MSYETSLPSATPERGFYYHNKHDPKGAFNHYAYEVMGLTRHTEDMSYLVRYRPLYQADYVGEAQDSVRPLTIWNMPVQKEGRTFARFMKITDSEIIAKLTAIRSQMYPD